MFSPGPIVNFAAVDTPSHAGVQRTGSGYRMVGLRVGLALWAGLLVPCSQAAVLDTSSQSPLTSRTSTPPQPNVMVTMDNSLSTQWDFMPEGSFTLNGSSIGLGYYDTGLSPSSVVVYGFPGNPMMGVGAFCYVQAVKNASASSDNIFQMQFRSPDVNTVFYNPDIRYRPWVSSASPTAEMSLASTSTPLWDPISSLSTSTFAITATQAATTRTWCTGFKTTTSSKLTFSPGLVYRLTAGANPTLAASYTRYDINDATNYAPATKHANRTDCAASKCTQAEELQNFANWFTYYRTRSLLMKGGMGRSLAGFVNKVRAGWAKFSTSSVIRNIRPFTASYYTSVVGDIYAMSHSGTTPTYAAVAAVGDYFKKASTDAENPWLTTVGTAGSGFLSCRRSVNVLVTDGYYNDTATPGNLDNTTGTDYSSAANNPLGFSPARYVPAAPFSDSYSNTLADQAMKYWVSDLQTSIDNKVAPVDGDIAFWQHLTQFMVGLGVSGTLDASSETAKLTTLRAIRAGTQSWPNPTTSTAQKELIDDMWHAAVNTGGDFYSVKDVTELGNALNDALGRATGALAKEAGVAVSSGTLVAGNLKFVPRYVSGSWVGDVDAYAVDTSGVSATTPTWTASNNLPTAANRKLYTWDGAASVAFNWDTLGTTNQTSVKTGLSSDAEGTALVNYIRGDTTNEGVTGLFRDRGGKLLGDFVDSPPVYVKDQVNLGYAAIDAGYTSYVASKVARSTGLVILGGNAGILHAFNSSTGAEVFGYVPRAGLANLHIIADKDYGTPSLYHQFFVNGPVIETDALITTPRSPTTAAWSNLVVGSMGVGGKGFFALHVPTTTPTALDDGKTVMWESPADADIGYVVGEIAVGKIKGGGWKAFVGNGVDSTNGTATLLVVNLASGVIEKRLTVDSTAGNGLMGVALLKDSNKEVVGAYAGDLRGNLWRFDFESGAAADWKIGFSGAALFQAKIDSNLQAITSAPQVVTRTAGGRLVLFGTGRLLTTTDADSTQQQSYYAVLDPTADGASSASATSPFASYTDDRSVLAPMTASTTAKTGTTGRSYYDVTGTAVDWATQKGWYMDLPVSRQRVIYPSIIISNDYVLIQTMIPAAAAASCETTTGLGYNYLLTVLSGQQISTPVFDTNGDGVVNSSDVVGAGYATSSDGRDQWVFNSGSASSGVLCNSKECLKTKLPDPPAAPTTRTIRDRVWRRLVNPPAP